MARDNYVPALRFDWLTPIYDPVVRITTREKEFKRDLIENAGLGQHDTVLDLGCGSGTLILMLGRMRSGSIVHGIDGDQRILGRANEKVLSADSRASLVQGMSFQLPYGEESFDHVFSSLFFHHLTTADKVLTLNEVRRVLKPDGAFHVADWGSPDNFATKIGSYFVVALDGFEKTRDNFSGRLPELITDAGFAGVEETSSVNTAFGTIRILRSKAK
ncbi:MAG: class I SAM-dependent methyltransferase [Acidobacteria bacterium]|nr:MAG: class I SAM-dependent methyltransferase [Acidobacteriota bacterium]REJ98253.1 MAG: class I SAM-dependent methyltransferase [Acidobacteriota bacterium]REK16997.1 MAG: class I SAM-dependent methyltransferase [Acidobacteriota bacterium]REK42907.1 MAG: class I SAM-dependent methyltransferase [Acidobacteriota bacterium]